MKVSQFGPLDTLEVLLILVAAIGGHFYVPDWTLPTKIPLLTFHAIQCFVASFGHPNHGAWYNITLLTDFVCIGLQFGIHHNNLSAKGFDTDMPTDEQNIVKLGVLVAFACVTLIRQASRFGGSTDSPSAPYEQVETRRGVDYEPVKPTRAPKRYRSMRNGERNLVEYYSNPYSNDRF